MWVSRLDYKPLKANLYLASGKLAKQALYEFGRIRGRDMVVKMTLINEMSPGKKTVVTYLDMEIKSIPDKFYNPAYLVKNNVAF